MLNQLNTVLSRSDIVGYAAAVNHKRISDVIEPYITVKQSLLNEYGEREVDENGEPTNRILVKFDSPDFDKFKKELERIGSIENEIDIFKINSEDVINKLTGNDILNIIWMFEDL